VKALVCRAWGEVESLVLEDVPAPSPKRDEVLIDVKATAVNYADALLVAGKYQTKPPLPFSPGLETAGVVSACGEGVTITGGSLLWPSPGPSPWWRWWWLGFLVGFAEGDLPGSSGDLVCSWTMIGACSRGGSAAATRDPTTYPVIGSNRTRPTATFTAIPMTTMILQ